MINSSDRFLDWIFPPYCALCRTIGVVSPCERCRSAFDRVDAPLAFLRPEIDASLALYPFRDVPGGAVRALKFARRTDLAAWMAEEMRLGFERSGFSADAVVPVPIHWRRRASRGFNQSEHLIAALPLPTAELSLRRIRPTAAQARLDPAARAKNLVGAFVASDVAGKRVLLVDDVVTSGHTARECARALRAAGATWIGVLAFAAANPD